MVERSAYGIVYIEFRKVSLHIRIYTHTNIRQLYNNMQNIINLIEICLTGQCCFEKIFGFNVFHYNTTSTYNLELLSSINLLVEQSPLIAVYVLILSKNANSLFLFTSNKTVFLSA